MQTRGLPTVSLGNALMNTDGDWLVRLTAWAMAATMFPMSMFPSSVISSVLHTRG